MILHYLTLAFRNLINSRLFSFINISGLAIGMAACAFILLWVQDEKSYDRFHDEPDEIYMGISHTIYDGIYSVFEGTPGIFASAATDNSIDVKSGCRVRRRFMTNFVQAEGRFIEKKGVYVTDSAFFTFFNFPIISGSVPHLFQKPDEVVISESLMREMFDDDNPIGQTISFKGAFGKEKEYQVVAATVTLESQLTFIRQKNLGFDKEYLFTVETREMGSDYQTVKQELMRDPAIISVTGTYSGLSDNINASNSANSWEGKTGDEAVSYYRFFVDSTIFRNLGMTFVEGSGFGPGVRGFRMGVSYEQGEENQFVINETMAKSMGLTKPYTGKWMVADHAQGIIVGVVKDFHYQSFYKEIAPMVIFYSPETAGILHIRTTAQDVGRAVAAVEKLWKAYNPNYAFTYSFMDKDFEKIYHSDIRTGQLFGLLSFIAVLISCLGLFGLVTYAAEAKTKEIGIRKVYGATIPDIMMLLAKEFLVLVGIAMLIAIPLSYYWLEQLLQGFAYRISIGWWIFAISGVITIVLTLLTVGRRAHKAATANPVESIKME